MKGYIQFSEIFKLKEAKWKVGLFSFQFGLCRPISSIYFWSFSIIAISLQYYLFWTIGIYLVLLFCSFYYYCLGNCRLIYIKFLFNLKRYYVCKNWTMQNVRPLPPPLHFFLKLYPIQGLLAFRSVSIPRTSATYIRLCRTSEL